MTTEPQGRPPEMPPTEESSENSPSTRHFANVLKKRGLTHSDLAEMIGRPVQYVTDMMSGNEEITRDDIQPGRCRCVECHRHQRRQFEKGVTRTHWESVNFAVHGSRARRAEMARDANSGTVAPFMRQRITHIGGTQLPFPMTFEQFLGGSVGLVASLPMISAFGMAPVPWMWLLGILTTLGGTCPWLIRKSRDTEKRENQKVARTAKIPSKKTRLASVRQDHEGVLLAWAKYETDVALQIDYPAMTDVRKPETAALAKALRAAEIASRHAGESIDSLIRYEAAVLDLEASFKAAETAAKLDHESPLTEDQKALAHTLLAMAVDPNGNLHERRQAHQRLLKLLDGVVVLAEPARLALEAAAAKREIGS